MPWQRAGYDYLCGGGCFQRIVIGAPMYVTKADWKLCEPCGTRVMGDGPPAELPAFMPVPTPIVETSIASEFSRFTRPNLGAAPRRNVVDFRQRQTGESSTLDDEETPA